MKKFLSILLVLTMIFTALTLSACKTDPENTSSGAVSSEESVTPPTKTELFMEALNGFETYFDSIGSSFGAELITSGTVSETLTLDKLSVMGEPMIAGDPLKIVAETKNDGEKLQSSVAIHLADEEILANVYTAADKLFLELPEVYADTVYEINPDSLTEGEEELPAITEETLTDLLESFEAAFGEAVDLESLLTVTETDGVTVYSFTLDEATGNKFGEALEKKLEESGLSDLLGLDDVTDDTDVDVSEDSEESEEDTEDSVVVELTVKENSTEMRISIREDETAVGEILFSVVKNGNITVIEANMVDEDVTLFETELSLTESETEMNLTGEMIIDTVKFDLDLSAAKESDTKVTFAGTFSMTVDMDGMLLTIPINLVGVSEVKGDAIEQSFTLDTSISGMFEFALSYTATCTPGKPEVTVPESGVNIEDLDSEEFGTQLALTYPNAAALLAELMGSGEQTEEISYENEDMSVYLTLYSDDTAELGISNLTYEKTDDTITFFYDGNEIWMLAYSPDSDGNYVICGVTCETMTGTPEEDGYLVNFYSYSETSSLDVYLNSETEASLSFHFPMDPESEDLVFTLPDGSTLAFEVEMSEDGSTLQLLGETMTQAIYTDF